jgi:hypothetical protein
MFGLLSRHHKVRSAPRRARPQLEHLESRDVPSTLTLNVTFPVNKVFTLTGTLSNSPNLGGVVINFTGVYTGSTATNSDGTFVVPASATSLGTITARTADGTSNAATVTLSDATPCISGFGVIQGPNQAYTFEGTVSYPYSYADLTVVFTPEGSNPRTIANLVAMNQNHSSGVDNTGHFEWSVVLDNTPDDNGYVNAQAFTGWGTASCVKTTYVNQTDA